MKMDKVNENGDNTVVATVHDKNGRITKKNVPFDELIKKFHKIRAGHMHKDRHSRIVCGNLTESEIDESDINSDKNKTKHARPSSARVMPPDSGSEPNSRRRSARRMSLPSLFHHQNTIGNKTHDTEGHTTPKIQENRIGVSCGLNRRRFSMPYVIKEYAKHDIDGLKSELRSSMDNLTPDTEHEDTEETTERGISGQELHSFYNMWEKTRKKLKKPLPRRLDAILRDEGTDNGASRPRLFTF